MDGRAMKTVSNEVTRTLERATDQAIEACDGDAKSAVRALPVANAALAEEID